MAYSKSMRPYRRYSVLLPCGTLYSDVRAHTPTHARELAQLRRLRSATEPNAQRTRPIVEVFEGTVRRAKS